MKHKHNKSYKVVYQKCLSEPVSSRHEGSLSRTVIKDGICYAYVTLVSPERKAQLRREFNDTAKKPHNLLLNYHHKVPLSLGGDNSQGNIVLMPKKEHEILHKYIISPQVEGLEEHTIKRIMLPVMRDHFFSFDSDDFRHFLKEFSKTEYYTMELHEYMQSAIPCVYSEFISKQRDGR